MSAPPTEAARSESSGVVYRGEPSTRVLDFLWGCVFGMIWGLAIAATIQLAQTYSVRALDWLPRLGERQPPSAADPLALLAFLVLPVLMGRRWLAAFGRPRVYEGTLEQISVRERIHYSRFGPVGSVRFWALRSGKQRWHIELGAAPKLQQGIRPGDRFRVQYVPGTRRVLQLERSA